MKVSFDEDDLLSLLERLVDSAWHCTCFAIDKDQHTSEGHSPSCRRVRVERLFEQVKRLAGELLR